MVRTNPDSIADVERNISFLERRIQEAGVQVGRKGRAARAAIPNIQAEILRLQETIKQGLVSPISAQAWSAVNANRTSLTETTPIQNQTFEQPAQIQLPTSLPISQIPSATIDDMGNKNQINFLIPLAIVAGLWFFTRR